MVNVAQDIICCKAVIKKQPYVPRTMENKIKWLADGRGTQAINHNSGGTDEPEQHSAGLSSADCSHKPRKQTAK